MKLRTEHIKSIVISSAILSIVAVLLMFGKSTRIPAVILLAVILTLLTLSLIYLYSPRYFKRRYLLNLHETSTQPLRHYADALNFLIGAAITDGAVLNEPGVFTTFNSMTPENHLRMGSLLKNNTIGEYDFSQADAIVDNALEKKIRVRGYPLIWGKLSDMLKQPDIDSYLQGFAVQERARILNDLIEKHITTVLTHFKDKINIWDVINEPLDLSGAGTLEENVFYRYLGEDYIANAFKFAHSIAPDAKLYLNEQLDNYSDKRAIAYFNLAKKLKNKGVPVHGAGIQSHITFSLPRLDDFCFYLQKFADLGLEVEITELEARLMLFKEVNDPYKAQGFYYSRMLEICLDNPACKGITFWGFCDTACSYDAIPWIFPKPNEPYLFDKAMNPKPANSELIKILKKYIASRN